MQRQEAYFWSKGKSAFRKWYPSKESNSLLCNLKQKLCVPSLVLELIHLSLPHLFLFSVLFLVKKGKCGSLFISNYRNLHDLHIQAKSHIGSMVCDTNLMLKMRRSHFKKKTSYLKRFELSNWYSSLPLGTEKVTRFYLNKWRTVTSESYFSDTTNG